MTAFGYFLSCEEFGTAEPVGQRGFFDFYRTKILPQVQEP
jgi:hypothetical protein